MGYGVLQEAPKSRAESTMGRKNDMQATTAGAPVDSLVPLARFTNAYEAPDRSHLIPNWGQGLEDKWDFSGCWDNILAQEASQAERRRNLLAQPLDAPESSTPQTQEAQPTAASDLVKLDPKLMAERTLHQQAKNLILTLYAQSHYVKARSRLQRGRGAAMENADPMQDMSAVERSLAAVRRLGMDPIQILKTGGFNTKQIQLVLDASKLSSAAASQDGSNGATTDEAESGPSEAGSPFKTPDELFHTPRTGSPLSPPPSRRIPQELGEMDGMLADVKQVKTSYLPSIQSPSNGRASPSPPLQASPSFSKLLPQRMGSPTPSAGKGSPQFMSLPSPSSPLVFSRGPVPRLSCEGSVRGANRGGLLGSSLSSSPLKGRWASESGAANPGPGPGRADIALPPVTLQSQGSIKGHHSLTPARVPSRGPSKDRFASLGLKPDLTLGVGLQ